ncbi:MAG: FecCD family ABC transporter permease [Pikeienuella sp.]
MSAASSFAARPLAGRMAPGLWLGALAAALCAVSFWSLAIGAAGLSPADLATALFADEGSRAGAVALTVRLPRLLAGLLAGSALAVAGAIMQAVTANPLASPGLLGVNAGAAFAVVVSTMLVAGAGTGFYIWWAFAGAGIAAALVYGVGGAGRSGATPLKLALAGAILSAFIGSLTAAILIFDKGTLDAVRIWTVGSVEGRTLGAVGAVAPYIGAGLVGALVFRGQVTVLSLGEDIARQVGQNVALWRLVSALLVVLLAGGAVAIAGPIGFVGLVVPHIARMLVGADYRRVIPASALGGALLVVTADAALRAALPARDIPVGVGMALIGAPFFIWLARNRIGGGA